MQDNDVAYAREAAGQGQVVVFKARRDGACGGCKALMPEGTFVRLDQSGAVCVACAGLGGLYFLHSGDAALTRRAVKGSPLHAVVVQWNRRRKRYERIGTLVDELAVTQAREACAADAAAREKKRAVAGKKREEQDKRYVAAFAEAVRRLYPGCPPAEADDIARHACEKHSGRVGRSAAAKELEEDKVTAAVIAHVRHVHTRYDRIVGIYDDKQMARAEVWGRIDEVLERWRRPAEMTNG
jgi:hypothetical protein